MVGAIVGGADVTDGLGVNVGTRVAVANVSGITVDVASDGWEGVGEHPANKISEIINIENRKPQIFEKFVIQATDDERYANYTTKNVNQ